MKRSQNPPPTPHPHPYTINFLSVLHQNKALHNFYKRRQRSIVERNIGLEYALHASIKSWNNAGDIVIP